jgi:hypothetical protein
MLTKCVNCEFNVRQDATFCFNCGTKNPSKPSLFKEKEDSLRGLMLVILLICMILAVVAKIVIDESQVPDLTVSNFAPALLIGFVIGIPFSFIIAPWINLKVTRKAKRKRRLNESEQTLCGKEDEIYTKKAEFWEENLYFESLLSESSESFFGDIGEHSKGEQKIWAKLEIIECEIALCDLQLDEIELVREKNKVLPFQQNFNRMDLYEIENALPIIKQNFDNTEDAESFDYDKRIHQTIGAADEIIKSKAAELENHCRELYEALIRRKTSLERGVEPMKETLKTFSGGDISLNNSVNFVLTDFDDYFKKLAIEFEDSDKNFETD